VDGGKPAEALRGKAFGRRHSAWSLEVNKMDKAINKITKYLPAFDSQYLQKQFLVMNQLSGAQRIFKRISSTADKEEIKDYIIEVWYSLVFIALAFHVEIEPLGKQGPDLKVSRDGNHAFVEIMRFRKIYPGPPEFNLSDGRETLSDYGNIKRDVEKAFGKILNKFSQVGNGNSIIAIWNDDGDMDDIHVKTAVMKLVEDANKKIILLPEGLFAVIYGSEWVHIGDKKQLYCFPLKRSQHSYQATWQKELESMTIREFINKALNKLQEDF